MKTGSLHRLSRVIRFSINPFLSETSKGANSYCAKPSGEGLALFLSLWVELEGELDSDTGFVINLTEIDKGVREVAVPVFDAEIRKHYLQGENISLTRVIEILRKVQGELAVKFSARLCSVRLELNPFRNVELSSENGEMVYYSEKFEFAAMHKLWNDKFGAEKNYELFGKCANATGHGHNYVLEVKVQVDQDSEFKFGGFQKVVDDNFIEFLDHHNLNEDVDYFKEHNPTVENITTLAWQVLNGKFNGAKLHSVTVWENDRAYCTYKG